MGGADIALSRDTSATISNPAGLRHIRNRRLDIYTAAAYAINVRHEDQFDNNEQITNRFQPFGALGYAQRANNLPIILGVSLATQGGSGYKYPNLNTAFGTTDDLSAILQIAKFSPSIAFQPSDRLSIGLSLPITYSSLEQEFFPNTSFVDPTNPGNSFFGFKFNKIDGTELGATVGIQYELNDRISLGLAYTSKVDMDMAGNNFEADMSALGIGKVSYDDVRLKGLALPQQLGAGIAAKLTQRLLIAFEINWLDWSSSLNEVTLTAKNPDSSVAPKYISSTSTFNWRDQYVVAIGGEYAFSERVVLRAGYNYGRNPIPDANLNPLVALIGTHHFNLGAGFKISRSWLLDSGIEYEAKNSVTYTNRELPFGDNAKETREGIYYHFTLSKLW